LYIKKLTLRAVSTLAKATTLVRTRAGHDPGLATKLMPLSHVWDKEINNKKNEIRK
jgi:hypothetical protein